MTTIVCKGSKMCSDSQATRGDFIDNTNTTKIFNVQGCLIGISGSLTGAMKFIEWFGHSLDHTVAQEEFPYVTMTPPEDLVNENFHCLVLYPDEKVFEFFGAAVGADVIEVKEEYCAVGSGMHYALSALDAGASAEEAVAVAIKRDVFSGGEVQTFEVESQMQLTEEEVQSLNKEQLVNLVLTGSTEVKEEEDIPATEEPLSEISSEFINTESIVGAPDYINISGTGVISDEEGEIISFSEGDLCLEYLKGVSSLLEVKHAHNISKEKLAIKLDEKVKELVAELNE